MIGFRIHYTIDVVIGVMIGHYIFILMDSATPYLDTKAILVYNYIQARMNKDDDEQKTLKQNNS